MVMLLSRKCPSTNFVFFLFFFNNFFFCNYLTSLCRICATTSTREKKKKKTKKNHPLTCLDICRMLSITSTGNVIVCLNGGGAVGELSCLSSPSRT